MHIVFCSAPLNIRTVEPDYEREQESARSHGFATSLISYEALVDESDATRAVRRVELSDQPGTSIYRGWMLRPETYSRLYEALRERGITLINAPDEYRQCHYLPESYEVIADMTPRTIWMPAARVGAVSMCDVLRMLSAFGDRPIIVKDYVKSRKHEWAEACFISSAADAGAVERVVRRFLELQGDDLNEGLVFREYVPFEPLAMHSKSGMPLTREYRIFVLDGVPLRTTEYWDEGDYGGEMPPMDQFTEIMQRVRSRFFTMDVAKRVDGGWMIVELGDGQVAGLPDRADVDAFYRMLGQRLA